MEAVHSYGAPKGLCQGHIIVNWSVDVLVVAAARRRRLIITQPKVPREFLGGLICDLTIAL
jgi:hypothetical protein